MRTDLTEAELWEYRSTQSEPHDFDEFWRETLADARSHPVNVRVEPRETGLTTLAHYDLTFAGFGGHEIKGWMVRPAAATGPLPTVVQYIGYGGGRGADLENLLWASAGYTSIVMDSRGQGSGHRQGVTADPVGSGPSFPGVMTRGIADPHDYYYRRLITDAVRAVDAALTLPEVDPGRVAVHGGSQGGALALATAALHERVAALVCFVPFLSDIRRATFITDANPYKEIGHYLQTQRDMVETVFETLSYFDGVNLATRATAPAIFTTSLMDPTCPPSTVFGAYHSYAGPKTMKVWQYNGHEGGGIEDERLALGFLAATL